MYEDWKLPALAERLVRLQEDVDEMEAAIHALEREIGGVTPNGPTSPIRKRLHELEGTRAAESAARSALAAVQAQRSAISSSHERRYWAAAAILVTLLNVLAQVYVR